MVLFFLYSPFRVPSTLITKTTNMKKIYFLCFFIMVASASTKAQTYHDLSVSNFTENWTNTAMITANDNWSGVASIRGFRGDALAATAADPQTITAADDPGVIDVNANQTNPSVFNTGGVTEFEIANPTIALTGSGTATAPYIKIYLNTTGRQGISLSFNAIDLDGSTDNAVQPIAVQYRVGNSGAFTNLPLGYIPDASTGPSLSGNTTLVSLTLPAAAENAAQVEVRIMTTNATGNDEFIGIDDIVVASSVLPLTFTRFSGTGTDNGIQLSWVAYATTTNGFFTVERSDDGRTFNPIANIAAVSGDRQYIYTDISLTPSEVYYRIAFTENGIKKYSSVLRLVLFRQSFAFTRFLSVNDNMAEAEIYSDRATPAMLRITDMNGVHLQQQSLSLQKGTQVLDIKLPVATKGVYIVTIHRGDEVITRRWVR